MSLKTDNQLMAEQLKSCKCVDKSMIIESNEIVNAIPNSLISKPFGTATHDTVVTEPLPNNAGQSGMAADCNLLQQQGQSNQSGIESISSQSESDTNDLEEKSTKVPQKKRHIRQMQYKPVVTAINPIRAGTKPERKVDMFIGGVDKHNSVNDMRIHMKTHNIKVNTTDIVEIPQMSGLKAFKISVEKSQIVPMKNIWPEGMKVDKFRASKTGSSNNTKRPYNNNNKHGSYNRAQEKKQPFHRYTWQGNSNHRNWVSWQSNLRPKYTDDNTWEGPQQTYSN